MAEDVTFMSPEPKITIGQALKLANNKLSQCPISNSTYEAKALLKHICDLTDSELIVKENNCMSKVDHDAFQHLVELRAQGVPLGRITGERSFWTLDLKIGPETLEPRQDTETLVETILQDVDENTNRDKTLWILDLGTGSGAILLALLSELPNASAIGTDISFRALQYARWNAQKNRLSERCTFICTDWLTGIKGNFDIIVSNPPYIDEEEFDQLDDNVRQYDPDKALKPGKTGLEAYAKIVQSLKDNSKQISAKNMYFEIGHRQRKDVEKIASYLNPVQIRCIKDIAGKDRVLSTKL